MPGAAPHPCTYPGCNVLVKHGSAMCEKHRLQINREADLRRPDARARGYDRRWEKARKAFLMAHPICEECKRDHRYVAATVVDHIVPHKGDMGLFWDRGNWQALCARHHNRKTATEDGGWGRKPG